MDDFESLFGCYLAKHKNSIERYVHYKVSDYHDAEDILQETYLSAFQKFEQLKDKESFKFWIVRIAGNKCNDYYRKRAKISEVFSENLNDEKLESEGFSNSIALQNDNAVMDTIGLLKDSEKQMIYLYYFNDMPQKMIAQKLNIPLGTVKSRLHNARQSFKEKYPYKPETKGEMIMSKLPEKLPEYTIKKLEDKPFAVKWEELMGWLIVPRLNEKLSWGIYEAQSGMLTEYTDIRVIGKAEVHGIEGVEITAVQKNASNLFDTGSVDSMERTFVAQLTDTHSRYLSESHLENGVKKCCTFLDGDAFLKNWGYGDNNCGNEINLKCRNLIQRDKDMVSTADRTKCLDIAGRYEVVINGKSYDTVCVMNIEYFDNGIVIEQFVDKNGRTVLWKRYNKNDWNHSKYNKNWTEILLDNKTISINGEIFVHWYDVISDYIYN